MSITEEWRDVVGFEGQYQVSNLGRLRSLDFTQTIKGRWGMTERKIKGRIRKLKMIKNGYLVVCLKHNKTFLVARLIAITFLGNPPEGCEVNHKDGVKTNNKVDNLEWVTKSENQIHRYNILDAMPESQLSGFRTKNQEAKKLTDSKLSTEVLKSSMTLKEISKKTGVSLSTIYRRKNSLKVS